MTASCWTTAPAGRSTSGKVPREGDGGGRGDRGHPQHSSDLPVRRAQSQRAGAPGGPKSGRGGHRPHGLLAPDTGGCRRPGVPQGGGMGDVTVPSLSLSRQVEILPQGCETPLFKQFFTNWK